LGSDWLLHFGRSVQRVVHSDVSRRDDYFYLTLCVWRAFFDLDAASPAPRLDPSPLQSLWSEMSSARLLAYSETNFDGLRLCVWWEIFGSNGASPRPDLLSLRLLWSEILSAHLLA
jgi:hypothetical protein